MITNLLLILFFLLSLAALLASVHHAQKKWQWHPEIARKSVHILMGLACLSLPVLFDEIYPIWLLMGFTLALLFGVRMTRLGRNTMGNALHGVERKSAGELWYALAVALIFTLATHRDELILFVVPMLVLAFSDAAAALIGIRYGQVKFITSDSTKSMEGSIAFGISCFFLVAFPLAVASDATALTVLLISLILGLLIMLLEGASWQGIDNLFIPLGASLLLQSYLDFSEVLLTVHTIVLALLMLFFFLFRKNTLLDGSGLLGVILISFFYWSLGGFAWLVAPTLYFFLYNHFSFRRGQNERYIHDIKSVISINGAGTACLVGYLLSESAIWLAGFCAAFAAQLTITGLARREFFAQQHSRLFNAFMAWLQGTVYILLPCGLLLWYLEIPNIVYWLGASSIGLALSLLLFNFWQPSINFLPRDDERWWRQAISGLPPTILALLACTGSL